MSKRRAFTKTTPAPNVTRVNHDALPTRISAGIALSLLRAHRHFPVRRLSESSFDLPHGLWLKGWDKLHQLVHNELGMTLKCYPLKLSEHTSKILPIRNTHFRCKNPVVLRGLGSLFSC